MNKLAKLAANNIMIGSDPEIFVENKEGRIVSGIDLIPGDKNNPHPITENGHCIQVDNIAWEFNIPASKTAEEFSENIKYVLSHLCIDAARHGLALSTKASDEIEPTELTDERALVFGCEPDFNAYTMMDNTPPNRDTNLRCVGGHVHIGYNNPNVETTIRIVKLFDLMVVLPAALIDKDVRRRELYGKPGAFRFKDFGVECRALSNFWIHTDELRKWVFEKTTDAVLLALEKPEEADRIIEMFSEYIEDVIMSNNKEHIEKMINSLEEELNSIYKTV